MRLIIVTFLFILFSSNFSLATDEKITLKEIESSILDLNAKRWKKYMDETWLRYPDRFFVNGGKSYADAIKQKSKTLNKRKELRKHLDSACEGSERSKYPKLSIIKDDLSKTSNTNFTRMTGSGSAIIGYFKRKKDALYGPRLFKKKYKNYWCIFSKTI